MTIGFLEDGGAEPVGLAGLIDVDELITGVVLSDAPWRHRPRRIRGLMAAPPGADYLPARYGALPRLFAEGKFPLDVAYVQACPHGTLGIHVGFMPEVMAAARRVVVEVNRAMPRLRGSVPLPRADQEIETDRPLLEWPARPPGPLPRAIAAHVVDLVPSGATIEVGLGSLPDAVLAGLASRRQLRIWSGMIGDAVVYLAEAGALANDDIVATTVLGTHDLYSWAASEPRIRLAPATETHAVAVVSRIDGFVAINSALEVDLTGQVGAEQVGERLISGIGGQGDFAAAATLSPGGKSIIALPATRVVDRLSGPVTTPRVDVTHVVTEHGVAELAGRTLSERASEMRRVRGDRA